MIIQRLKERKFVQWALGYLAGAFVVVQLLEALAEPLGLSTAVQRVVLVLVATGFFITLVLAWYHGEKGRQAVSGVEAVLVGILVGVAGFVFWTTQRADASLRPGDNPTASWRIAVLPFLDMSAQGDDSNFGDGIADGILSALATIPGLVVLDRQSSFQPEVVSSTPTEIGDKLSVDMVVGGQVEEVHDLLRLSVNLLKTIDGSEFWKEEFVWEWTQFSSLNEVAWRIAEVLLGSSAAGSAPSMGQASPRSHEAWFLYWRGVEEAHKGDRAGLERAVEYFGAAIQIDQEFGLAYAGLADAYLDLASDDPTLVMVQVAVTQALNLDSTSAQAHAVQGRLWNEPGTWIEAERELRMATRLQPSFAPAHMWLGNNLLVRGRIRGGLSAFEEARKLDPLSARIAVGLSQAFSAAGYPEQAIVEARRAAEMNPGYPYGHSTLAVALAAVGQFEEALVEADTAVALLEESPNALATLAAIHAKAGNRGEAREILETLKNQTGSNSILPTALVHANLDEKDSAFALLHRVPSWTPPNRDWLRNSPVWSPIRDDPRWTDLLSSLGMN